MSWSLLRMVRYVKQSKYLQQLKDNEEVWSQAFPSASFLMFCKDRPLLATGANPRNPFALRINWRSYEDIEPYCEDVKGCSVVLGVDEEAEEDKALFVCPVIPEKAEEIQVKFQGKFADMRTAISTLNTSEAYLAGRGYTMLRFNETCKYCQTCGSPMQKVYSGCSRKCTNTSTGTCENITAYPSIFPVAITRVINHTKDQILLVRQPRHPKGMYSCIAGFMEPGEDIIDAVRREVAEEAGIVVEDIRFFNSQPWPITQSSLMMGLTAIAMEGSEHLDIDKNELEDAKWFSKDEVQKAVDRIKETPALFRDNPDNLLVIPPRGAIANQLVRDWLENS